MTRILTAAGNNPTNWLEPGANVNWISQLKKQTLFLASKRDLNAWLLNAPSDVFRESLLEVPRSSKGPEANIQPDFELSNNDSTGSDRLPGILVNEAWMKLLEERQNPPKENEPLEESWERIFGKVVPLAREIEILDPYFFTELRKSPSVIEQIFDHYLSQSSAKITVHALSATGLEESDLSDGGVQRLSELLKGKLKGAAVSQFSVMVYPKKLEHKAGLVRFPRDRYLRLGFDGNDLKIQLGHGLEIFDPKIPENALAEQPSYNWTEKVLVPLSMLKGTAVVGPEIGLDD